MYPSSEPGNRNNRVKVDSELGSFYAGTQFRTFKEITLAVGATYVIKMVRPLPHYVPQCTLTGGGTFTGGTLYDLMKVKTANASGQASTVDDSMVSQLGAPAGSTGIYKFTNLGNETTTCIFSMWWEELPTK